MTQVSYDELIEMNPDIAEVLDRRVYTHNTDVAGPRIDDKWLELWHKNITINTKKLLKKHGFIHDNSGGLGLNKAVICIGAGPSLNRDLEMLEKVCYINAHSTFESMPFILIACNHQFKPLLEKGIIPHFVLGVDAGEALYEQLCVDIPKEAENVCLIAPLHISPRVAKEWDRQGRVIDFYVPNGKGNIELVDEITGESNQKKLIIQGGNVLNTAWSISMVAFKSRVFMALGNDLSYGFYEDIDDTRNSYYADGDYSAQKMNKRDDAKFTTKWMGYEAIDGVFTPQPVYNLKSAYTTMSLFHYKTWIETNVTTTKGLGIPFQYYNCSNKSILGVIPEKYEKEHLEDPSNWRLMDDILPGTWKTMLFERAVNEYMEARKKCRTGIDALDVVGLQGQMDIARIADQNQNERIAV